MTADLSGTRWENGDPIADLWQREGLKPSGTGCRSERIRLAFQGEMILFLNLLPSNPSGLWVATNLMSLTCDICRADWKWLEASVCLCHCLSLPGRLSLGFVSIPPGDCLLLLIVNAFLGMRDGQCA